MTETENKDSLSGLLDAYQAHMAGQGRSRKAIIILRNPSYQLIRFLARKGVTAPKAVTEELLKDFQKYLYAERGFERGSVKFYMQHIRLFFDFIIQRGKLTKNEARGIEVLPKQDGPQKPLPKLSGIDKKESLSDLLDSYGEYLFAEGKSRVAVVNYSNPNRQLVQFLSEKGITNPKDVTEELLKEFQQFLYDERDFAHRSVVSTMRHTARFFDFLILYGKLKRNYARGIEILSKPGLPQKQLSHFYTFEEILPRYLRSQEKWVSYRYLHQVEKHLKGFIKFLRANEIGSVYGVSESTLLKYRKYLWDEFVEAREDGLVVKSQIDRLRIVVKLFKYLCKEGILKSDPAKNLGWETYYKEIIEKAKALPKRPELPQRDLTELDKLALKFLEYETGKGKDPSTIKTYERGLRIFFGFMDKSGIENLSQVTKRFLLEYYSYVCNYTGVRYDKPLSGGYKNRMIWTVKLFFQFLVRFDFLSKDPSLDLESMKEERGLPRTFLNEKEVITLMEQPRLNHNPLIARDKAILELLFSTGVRSNELCSLNIEDVDPQQEMVRINVPKGGASRQRIIPVGRVALEYISIYLRDARPIIENGDGKALFLSCNGHRLNNEAILRIVQKYSHECGFRKHITTHSLRVTCATLMLKNGADIRYVQEQLGHKKITSTQVYTRLMPLDLKSIHQRCHPRERKAAAGSPEKSAAPVSANGSENSVALCGSCG